VKVEYTLLQKTDGRTYLSSLSIVDVIYYITQKSAIL